MWSHTYRWRWSDDRYAFKFGLMEEKKKTTQLLLLTIIHRQALDSNKLNQTFTYNPHRNKVISFTTNRPFSTRYLRQFCAERDSQQSLCFTVKFDGSLLKTTELKQEFTSLWMVLLHSHHTLKTTSAFIGLRILQIYFQSWQTYTRIFKVMEITYFQWRLKHLPSKGNCFHGKDEWNPETGHNFADLRI